MQRKIFSKKNNQWFSLQFIQLNNVMLHRLIHHIMKRRNWGGCACYNFFMIAAKILCLFSFRLDALALKKRIFMILQMRMERARHLNHGISKRIRPWDMKHINVILIFLENEIHIILTWIRYIVWYDVIIYYL